jgi:hypothetical protein
MEETETVIDIIDISRELYDLKNKYERLKEGHRKLLIVNQNLEEKVFKLVYTNFIYQTTVAAKH